MFSIPAAPAKQSVNETISILSGRLSSSTLLEDRRAAILGLRSFAKDYPATVASGALRSLIGSLTKDGEDVDTVKGVLETLLMLFSPNEDSPEASDEIALWLADEFTQRQENITLLLDFLDSNDFYSRLYTLQLLIAILSARPERTEECIFTAPLGISRLVAGLDDQREAVRNEAITLLTYLTPSSTDVQKLVAFENAFDRVFRIIDLDGSLHDGSRTVEDCFILLANLLRRNDSNQSLFRESGGILHLSRLLEVALQAQEEGEEVEVAGWAQAQRCRNIYALLALVRLMLVGGAVGTQQNQKALWQHGFLYHALQLSFSRVAQIPIKAEALVTCADIIRGNANLQENFAQLQVPSPLDATTSGTTNEQHKAGGGATLVYIIDGLLDLTLTVSALEAFDIRQAACDCLKAYFFQHADVRTHFLKRAIEGFQAGADEIANVLTVLLRPDADGATTNPYRVWFAATIMFHLLFDNPEAKSLAMAVTEGDADNGEEVVTGIQIIAANLVTALNREQDARIIIGYISLLLGWMYEDLDAVNDFLEEGSNIQSLIQAVVRPAPKDDVVQGLCAMLLGLVYEFSTKDSVLPRSSLHSILLSRMGRERFLDKMSKLRSHPSMRDFEVIPQKLDPSTGSLPEVFFDGTFVDFFKDNYSRIVRAIDRDPTYEVSVVANGVQKGISRELVDSLREQLKGNLEALEDARVTAAALERQLGQEQADHRRSREQSSLDLARAKTHMESLHHGLETEIESLRQALALAQDEHKRQMDEIRTSTDAAQELLRRENSSAQEDHKRQIEYIKKANDGELEKLRRKLQEENEKTLKKERESQRRDLEAMEKSKRRADADAADLRATISRLEVDLMKANQNKSQQIDLLRKEAAAESKKQQQTIQDEIKRRETSVRESAARLSQLEGELQLASDETRQAKMALEEEQLARQSAQTELDDLLMVFSDLEEKVANYKARLKANGEDVSDGEGDDDDDDDDDDDGDEEGDQGDDGSGDEARSPDDAGRGNNLGDTAEKETKAK